MGTVRHHPADARAAGSDDEIVAPLPSISSLPPRAAITSVRSHRRARAGGKLRYGDEVLERLSILGVAKQAGFSLDEIRLLFEATHSGAPAHTQVKELTRRKLPEVGR
jgi:hypothetical protein